MIVEAKNDNIKSGLGQCVAEMVAAADLQRTARRRTLDHPRRASPPVASGSFLKLDGDGLHRPARVLSRSSREDPGNPACTASAVTRRRRRRGDRTGHAPTGRCAERITEIGSERHGRRYGRHPGPPDHAPAVPADLLARHPHAARASTAAAAGTQLVDSVRARRSAARSRPSCRTTRPTGCSRSSIPTSGCRSTSGSASCRS